MLRPLPSPPSPPLFLSSQVEKLKEHARPVKGSSEIRSVASISAGNDEEIGKMIADALDKVCVMWWGGEVGVGGWE